MNGPLELLTRLQRVALEAVQARADQAEARVRELETALAAAPHLPTCAALEHPHFATPCSCYVSRLPARAQAVREVVEAALRFSRDEPGSEVGVCEAVHKLEETP